MPLVASRPTTVGAATSIVLPCAELGAREDEEARRRQAVLGAQRVGLGRAEDDALLRRLRHPLRRRAHDEEDEDVQEDEERDLADQERLVGFETEERHDGSERPNTTSVEPSVIRSPSRTRARSTRLPLTSTPFVEPRSTIQ